MWPTTCRDRTRARRAARSPSSPRRVEAAGDPFGGQRTTGILLAARGMNSVVACPMIPAVKVFARTSSGPNQSASSPVTCWGSSHRPGSVRSTSPFFLYPEAWVTALDQNAHAPMAVLGLGPEVRDPGDQPAGELEERHGRRRCGARRTRTTPPRARSSADDDLRPKCRARILWLNRR